MIEAAPARERPVALPWMLGGLLVTLAVVSAASGAVALSPGQLLAVLWAKAGGATGAAIDAVHEAVLFDIRLPRIALGALCGAALATSGAALQGLFRNPLVDPALIGSSSGAALAAAMVIVLGSGAAWSTGWAGAMALPVASFIGAATATWGVYRLSRAHGRTDVATLLLLGLAVNALAGVGLGLLTFLATDAQLRDLSFWQLGSVAGAGWETNAAVAVFVLPATLLLCVRARQLDVLSLGEREAGHLGVDVERLKREVVLLSALSVGASVSATGAVGFVGLLVPHLVRLAGGPAHRRLLPSAALAGAALVVGADLTARTAVAPAELPLGVVTAALGAPVFFALVLRRRGAR